jgi:hypothetical protein
MHKSKDRGAPQGSSKRAGPHASKTTGKRRGDTGPAFFLLSWALTAWPVFAQEAPAPTTQPAEPDSSAPVKAEEPTPAAASPEPVPSPSESRPPDAFPISSFAPVLLLTDGLDESIPLSELRRRLSEALSREVVPLVDARARRAHASIWLGMNADTLVLRVTPPQRAEVWRQLARSELGSDPVATIVKAVLEMLWADAFARLDMSEVQDPFCPSGMICVDPRHTANWPQRPEVEVLDPWDPNYPRFYTWDPGYPSGSQRSPWAPPYAQRGYRAAPSVATPSWPAPAVPRKQELALGLLAGGGVHKGGAFLRYEVNFLRRFPRFDFGLAYVAARGQPEPFQKARRAVLATLQRRFVTPDFELDLGLSFGMFVATLEGQDAEVRPYLRGLLTFALPLGSSFDLLVQSELGTTFASVKDTGAVEYALTLGLRHRF